MFFNRPLSSWWLVVVVAVVALLVLPVVGGCGDRQQAIRGRDRLGRHVGGGDGAEAAATFRISELFEV